MITQLEYLARTQCASPVEAQINLEDGKNLQAAEEKAATVDEVFIPEKIEEEQNAVQEQEQLIETVETKLVLGKEEEQEEIKAE